jgi:hypothetical protein
LHFSNIFISNVIFCFIFPICCLFQLQLQAPSLAPHQAGHLIPSTQFFGHWHWISPLSSWAVYRLVDNICQSFADDRI